MKKFSIIISSLAFLSFFSNLVSACGVHEEEAHITGNAIYGGILSGSFFVGIVFALSLVALVLGVMLFIRRMN